MSENFMQLYGAKLVDAGYRVIPIAPGTKRPGRFDGKSWGDLARWTEVRADQTHVNIWSEWTSCGVGIITGEVVAIDIDVLDESVALAVGKVFQDRLGQTDMIRIGKSPKALYLYRTNEPFTKISLHPIEVLGVGQQFVSYAIHPETGQPYRWPFDNPAETPVSALPLVTREQVLAAAEEAYKTLPPNLRRTRLVSTVIPDKDARTSHEGLVGTLSAVEDALKFVPNPDLSWDDWNRIGMAIYCATEAKGFHIFDQWSRESGKYNSLETNQRWEHYSKSPPSRIGAGSLYFHAQQNGWAPPPHLDLNPIKAVKVDLTNLKEPKRIPKSTRENFPTQWFESYSLVGRVTRWIINSAQQPQPTFALANAIVMFGAIFGRRYAMEHINTRCNIFAIAVAKPGAGKDHSRQRIKELMVNAGLHQLICGDRFSSGVAILRTLFDYPSRISHLDEMGLYLQSLTAKNAASHQRDIIKTLLEVYSSSSGMYHGQEYADSRDRQRLDINQPNFNFFGTTTPRTLIPALSHDMVDNGTLSRILFVPPFEDYPDPQTPTQDTLPPEDIVKDIMDSYTVTPAGIGNLTNQPTIPNSTVIPMVVKWDTGVFDEYQRVKDWQINQSRNDEALWVRYSEMIVKICMIEAIAFDPISPTVTQDIFKMSKDLARWSFNYTAELMQKEVAENDIEASHKRVLNFIRKQGEEGASSTQLAKSLQGMKARDRNEIIQTLLESGDVVEEVIAKDGPGRSRRIYKVRK
jgi:hypothetical protein